ncbi:LAMI_0F09934g1_1 [Lachancea mirantina]|uniref:Actin cytoskeleton-regulatory complex protein END3 n=1 Tax=Lachancea mirantina TaxID=1230905 RepID=A0A1G4K1H0_9SACH|nr:LAMI_0F09934g1_1 [Lachancea mirantina]
MPKLEQFEIKKYWQIFSGLKPEQNKLNHDQVLPILYNSKLDSSILNKIWFLADIDDDDNLDFEEFVICMRLIFDMVNKNIDSVPEELPDWLVPGSKASLVKERAKRKQAEREQLGLPGTETSSENHRTPVVEQRSEPKQVDWYISPANKDLYTKIFEKCNVFTDGTVSFPSLANVVKAEFPQATTSEIDQVWNLVNPSKLKSMNKDPAVYLIHIIKQKSDLGCSLPTELPHALAEICKQQRASYDLNSRQAEVRRGHNSRITSSDIASKKPPALSRTSDLESAPEGSDWEVVKLKQELAELDSKMAGGRSQESSVSSLAQDTDDLRKQFEDLLAYKQEQITRSPNAYRPPVNASSVSDDIYSIEQQVDVLEQYLSSKKQELAHLQDEIRSLR